MEWLSYRLSPPFWAILSFSRRAHWFSCCAHGGLFVRLGVEEWERWATWVGLRCGAVASALLRQSCDTAEALSEMFLVASATRLHEARRPPPPPRVLLLLPCSPPLPLLPPHPSARESLPPSALHAREPMPRLEAERKDRPKGRSFP